jgi:type II secretory pathway component PulF
MPIFEYSTQKMKGAPVVKRRITAENIQLAERELLQRQIPVLSLDKADDRPWHVKWLESFKRPSVPMKVKLTFAQQVAAAQRIQMPLLDTLTLCVEATVHPKFKIMLEDMRRKVEEGSSLYDAMKYPGIFDALALGLVRAGEESGKLGETFDHLKNIYRRNEMVRKKVVGLMVYPAGVLIIASFVIFFLMWFTIPQFVGLFSGSGMELPIPTKILIAVSGVTVGYPWAVLLGIFAFSFGILRIPAVYRAIPALHPYVLKMPVVGSVQKRLIQETFARTFVSLLKAELKYLEALQLCRTISTNFVYRGSIARAVVAVSFGNSLMVSLEEDKDVFGLLLIRSLGFGELTGKIEEVLTPLAEMLSFEITEYIDGMKNYIEPIFTALIGGVVLLIMLALFMPIFALPRLISGRNAG